MASIIDGTAVAARVRAEVSEQVAAFRVETGRQPGLATILVGNDPASEVYIASKRKACVAVGIADLHRHLPATVTQNEVAELLDSLAVDSAVSGILLQLPVPEQLDSNALIERIPAMKDVDGLSIESKGRLVAGKPGLRPCTPLAVVALLDAYRVAIEGAAVVVVGRSQLVGTPVAQLLIQRNATVTIAHSQTRNVADVCRQADILVVAAGVSELIGAEAIKPGATVIDVGIHRTEVGLRGDVDFNRAREVAGLITPVPGGVGPMTIAMLLHNTLQAAQLQSL